MITIEKPSIKDMSSIGKILSEWTEKEEMEKYSRRILREIKGKTEFNMHFWLARQDKIVIGVSGLSDPLPKIVSFAQTCFPCELKILYIDNKWRGKGIGRILINFIEKEVIRRGYTELLVRSAERYKNTAWGFYLKTDFKLCGIVNSRDKSKMMKVFRKSLVSFK